jgi:hypothetical protein
MNTLWPGLSIGKQENLSVRYHMVTSTMRHTTTSITHTFFFFFSILYYSGVDFDVVVTVQPTDSSLT